MKEIFLFCIQFVTIIIINKVVLFVFWKFRMKKYNALLKRMFQLGLHEGSNRWYYNNKQSNDFVEKTFEEYFKEENK